MNIKNWSYYIFIFSFLLILDQITKQFAIKYLYKNNVVLCNYINLNLSLNKGICWGTFNSLSPFGINILTTVIAGVIGLFFLYTILEYKKNYFIEFEVLVLAGAISNFLDRIIYGSVVDFIECHINTWYWPTFNIADSVIVIGIIGIIAKGLVCKSQKK